MAKSISVGIVGISGYTGLELLKLLLNHKYFHINYLANTQGGTNLADIHTMLDSVAPQLKIHKANAKEAAKACDVLFLALPHKHSMAFVKTALESKPTLKIIDLSADYRLNKAHYEAYYDKHIDTKNLSKAIYGLVEYNRAKIKNANLVANPGCYPTASLLGLLPFLPYIDTNVPIFIDAKSGVSGAGKGLSERTHFAFINENALAYQPLTHRHSIEIIEKCQDFGKKTLDLHFVSHLLPLTRGMLVSIFATLKKPLNQKELDSILAKAYKSEPFIRIAKAPVSIANVVGSHYCDIFATTKNALDSSKNAESSTSKGIFINTAIDNLLRGASSQALANANLMCGFKEDIGLPAIPFGIA